VRAIVIWLDAGLEVLADRLAGSICRPLLTADSLGQLTVLKAIRDPLYARAHYRVDGGAAADAVVEAILGAMRRAVRS
jgi:shikimate kinase